MFKMILSFIPFLKELFFDNKEEMDFKSPNFNVKKWLRFALQVVTLLFCAFIVTRLYIVMTKYIKLQKQYTTMTATCEYVSKKNIELQTEIKVLQAERDHLIYQCQLTDPQKPKLGVKKTKQQKNNDSKE